MKKNFFKSIGVFLRALPDVLLYELIFKLLLLSVGAPLLTLLLKLTMKISHVRYISDEKVWIYLKNPATIIAILLILFFSAMFSFMELSGLAACYSCYYKGERLSVIGMFRTGFFAFKKAFRGKGLLCFLTFAVYMPIAQYTISSGIFLAPLLPILRDAFHAINTRGAFITYIAVQVIFVIFIVSRSYSLHFLVLTDKPLYDCTQESRKLIIGQKMKYVLSLVLWSLFIVAATAVITFALSFVVLLFIKGFTRPNKALVSSLKVLKYEGDILRHCGVYIDSRGNVLADGTLLRRCSRGSEDNSPGAHELQARQTREDNTVCLYNIGEPAAQLHLPQRPAQGQHQPQCRHYHAHAGDGSPRVLEGRAREHSCRL